MVEPESRWDRAKVMKAVRKDCFRIEVRKLDELREHM